jgi:alkanesulfonate monooxygenase SsuD/methylene tetrahydromethanopterin reductase-like flavin-dependent oxidoreductase (luciferase family)
MLLTMRHDFRAPVFGATSLPDMYAAALEQCRWADRQGWDVLAVPEHHGMDDGWLPAPLTMAGVLLAATANIRVLVSAAIVPLHDPVRLAEQIAVLDNVAPGRLWIVAGAGYWPEEFAMADVPLKARGRLLEEYVGVMLQAWTGKPFEWRGRTITVHPVPASTPHPIFLIGGGVEAAARRAARLGLPMLPMNDDPRLAEWYADEAAKVGFTTGMVLSPSGPTFVHVTEDPDQTWAEIAPYLLYEARTYAERQPAGQTSLPLVRAENVADLKASKQILVGTPEQVLAAAAVVSPMGSLTFNPLAGGLPPDLAWRSLELFAAKVQPRLPGRTTLSI